MKQSILGLALALALALSAPLRAAMQEPAGTTLTVKAGAKALNTNDLQFIPKADYVYLIINASPYLAGLPGGKAGLRGLVAELLKKEGLARFPKAKLFKIDVADVSERDDYGLPAWDKIKLIERYTAKPGKHGLTLQKIAVK